MYYRCSRKQSPMSAIGHAMFSNDLNKVDGGNYGKNIFKYDGETAVSLEDLEEAIKEAIFDSEGEIDGFGNVLEYCEEMECSVEEFIKDLNPPDIVGDAGVFDDKFLTLWLYDEVLEPKGITAVLTHDGAVVFDESLIKYVGVVEEF